MDSLIISTVAELRHEDKLYEKLLSEVKLPDPNEQQAQKIIEENTKAIKLPE